jgi:hypothetical protein
MARQVARFSPLRLVLERSEPALYTIDRELREAWPSLAIVAVVGDVGDRERMLSVFREHRPQVVAHAGPSAHGAPELRVGFILAAIAVKSSIKASAAIAVAVPLLALALPILDVGLAVVRRVVRRRPVFEGDRDHIHHRLVDLGLTPRRAVITLYGVAVLFTSLGLAIVMGPRNVVWAVVALALLVVWAGVRALGYWEVTEFQRSFMSRLMSGLRASGDAALRGAEDEIARTDSIEGGWERLCQTAWELGLTELHLTPKEKWAGACPELRAFCPPVFEDRGPVAVATWSIEVEVGGKVVAEVTARRPLDRMGFDPRRFAEIVRGLVRRQLEAAAGGSLGT